VTDATRIEAAKPVDAILPRWKRNFDVTFREAKGVEENTH
jgi:hypothetical protein